MMRWENLILDTVQIGGSLVFLTEKAPSQQREWFKPLQNHFAHEIPFVLRRTDDLLTEKFKTRPEDLVIVFSEQKEVLKKLNHVLQGQRVLVTEHEGEKNPYVDFAWNCDEEVWTHALQSLRANWDRLQAPVDFAKSGESPCLFLDRDDVIVKNVPYNKDPDAVQLMPGIEELINRAHAAGYWVALVTNQSGLGRGWISWHDYQLVHQQMMRLLAQKGCWIDECVWSPFIDQEGVPQGRFLAGLRKPRAGMFQMVHAKLKVNMSKSAMVGDSASDLMAAFSAGVKDLYLFNSEKVEKEKQELYRFQTENPQFSYNLILDFKEVEI
ncbi:D-glycero-alpha-D-manno-heptose-1,7-bisphosphate 7-phosphatase [Bdellovibrio bacteriovorus]|uniref:D-glycero-alpha-D-manno-heptose-1,7-bisphosphate 7-phosphatase n=1 Tax=Bdellovibrio bacteriovorus TaxID=959 RepID=UPI0035A66A9F